jgi:hypothetical protein
MTILHSTWLPIPEYTHLKHENGGNKFLRNVGTRPQNYTVSQLRRKFYEKFATTACIREQYELEPE